MENEVPVYDRVSVNSLTFSRAPEAPDGAFRTFDASIEATDHLSGVRSTIGHMRGWLGWAGWLPELVETPQLEGSIAVTMAQAAVEISESLGSDPAARVEAVLMVDQLHLEPEWRGLGSGRRVAEQLIDLLLLTPETTLILAHFRTGSAHCQPHPVTGALQDPQRERLIELHRPSGFQPWGDGAVWWVCLGTGQLVS